MSLKNRTVAIGCALAATLGTITMATPAEADTFSPPHFSSFKFYKGSHCAGSEAVVFTDRSSSPGGRYTNKKVASVRLGKNTTLRMTGPNGGTRIYRAANRAKCFSLPVTKKTVYFQSSYSEGTDSGFSKTGKF